nr:MAG TPA: hypothetical protein [Caudoviricetes sp.]
MNQWLLQRKEFMNNVVLFFYGGDAVTGVSFKT